MNLRHSERIESLQETRYLYHKVLKLAMYINGLVSGARVEMEPCQERCLAALNRLKYLDNINVAPCCVQRSLTCMVRIRGQSRLPTGLEITHRSIDLKIHEPHRT
jgi:hypothetical protein